jgi:hypothetical protein
MADFNPLPIRVMGQFIQQWQSVIRFSSESSPE